MNKVLTITDLGDFCELFHYAEEHFGISWNPANDVFFNNSLDYGRINRLRVGEGLGGYVGDDRVYEYDKAQDIPIEIINDLSDCDKSYVILEHYLESKNVTTDEVIIDCS